MSISINQLARSIDIVARRCPRGLSALIGEVEPPSHDELVTAATWRPASEVDTPIGSGDGEQVTNTVAQVLALTGPIEAVGWARIVAAACEIREMYPLPFKVYRLHVNNVGSDQWRDGSGGVRRIAEKCGVSVATVTRWRHLVPRRIAKTALK